jgi:crossover junction endodeoxyribonuclease RusA
MTILITVEGTARPQGSKRHVGNGIMVESSKHVASWRNWVRLKAVESMAGRDPIAGAVEIVILFAFDRPKKHSTSKGLRPTAPRWHTGKPDADKLLRAILDALTGVCFRDDSQVAQVQVQKAYGVAAKVEISIAELNE